jgi:hypothetical protein
MAVVTMGDFVQAHLNIGTVPAIVTRVNVDGTLSLTCFAPADIVYKDNVRAYVPEADDEDADKIGYWSAW